ncbi:MAG: AbrB/MazE/SpoVT family DNA-binding domain-containing protein [Clostridia bacterium]|nr:AbrB/MazE/SpoVT family DNA-binding domain-containing protein [Clostridia bacterium]
MIKSTGIVRRVDDLGRVVIPIELRRTLDIGDKDSLEIYVDGDKIILRKYEPACVFCGSAQNVQVFRNKNICQDCIDQLARSARLSSAV